MQYSLNRNIVWSLVAFMVISGLLFSCSSEMAEDGKVVFTQLPVDATDAKSIANGKYRYSAGMTIAMDDISEMLQDLEILTQDFFSARAPEISHDGKKLVFSAQNKEDDIWQIWIMNLENREVTPVTSSKTNCTDPTWLPDERIAFSKVIHENDIEHHALFTIGFDGCCEQQITFQPHDDLNASILEDGRILFSSQQLFPEEGAVKYMVMRPDGTKAELFYQPNQNEVLSKATEDGKGYVLFAESGSLTAVKFTRPLHTKNTLKEASSVNTIFNLGSSNFLLSLKLEEASSYGLSMFNQDDLNNSISDASDLEHHLLEPVIVAERMIPRKLPTRVNTELETGYFLCMDANQSQLDLGIEAGNTSKVQVLGFDEVLGEAEVSEDGSFYLELSADQPVRFQTLNEAGEILRGPSSWMWVRPNERRGCVGCHEDGEVTPHNVVPKAVEKAPFAMIK